MYTFYVSVTLLQTRKKILSKIDKTVSIRYNKN